MKRLSCLAIAIVSAWFVADYARAQQPRPMTFDDVIAVKNVSDPQISTDGQWVVYVVTAVDMKENASNSDLWLAATKGGAPIRLTTSKKSDNQPRWSPDGRKIAFISAREEKPQIFLISPFGGEAEKLTDSKSGVQSFQWAPDGLRIAYTAQEGATPEDEKRLKDKDDARVVDKDFKFSRIWLIDLDTRKASELVKGDYHTTDPQWSPDGRAIAYTRLPTPKPDDGNMSDVWIVDVASGDQHKLYENDGPDTAPRWSPDGRQIALLTRDSAMGLLGQLRLAVVPAVGGAPMFVAPTFEYQPGAPTWSQDGKTLYFNATTRTTSQLYSSPAGGGQVSRISRMSGVMSAVTFSRDRMVAAFTKGDTQSPSDVYVAKLPGFEAARLTDHNPQVRDLALGKSEVIRWKSSDGLEIEGIVIYPIDYQPGKRYPLIAMIHGGPSGVWMQSFPSSWGNYGHVWAGRGWICFYPNVRGSSAYGEKFLLANVKDWGGGDYRDIQSGIDYLVAKGIADPEKLGQTGWSYGGYMTAWTLTQTNRFKAVMVGAGLTNMFSMYSTNDLQRVLEGYFGAEPWDDLEGYWKKSAMAYIKQARTPTLILHGAEDKRVPVGQAQELYMGLRKNDVPVELVFYPREPHGLQEPRHQLDKMRREYAWFSKHVLGVEVAEPKPEKGEEKPAEKPAGRH